MTTRAQAKLQERQKDYINYMSARKLHKHPKLHERKQNYKSAQNYMSAKKYYKNYTSANESTCHIRVH